MVYLLVLFIFWKPLYNFIMWASTKFSSAVYKSNLVAWFEDMFGLIKP